MNGPNRLPLQSIRATAALQLIDQLGGGGVGRRVNSFGRSGHRMKAPL